MADARRPLAAAVVKEDHRLETSAERSREELARHRWHWTLDESNPKRVPIREYARAVARNKRTIQDMVNGYAAWAGGGAAPGQLADELERAKIRGAQLAATEAVAEAKGISLGTARRHHANDVREVEATARERAVRNRTTPEEEAPRVAQQRQSMARAAKQTEANRKAAHTLRYVEMEGKIAAAKRYLSEALRLAQDVPFADEERDLLTATLGELRAILNLIDLRMSGSVDVDWDGELAKITGGGVGA